MNNDVFVDVENYIRSQRRERNGEIKPAFWTLHVSSNPDLNDKQKANANWKNFSDGELDSSIMLLNEAIQVLSRSNHRYFVLLLRTSETDKYYTQYPFENPYYQPRVPNNMPAAIMGMGGMGAINGEILQIQKQMFEMKMEYEEKIRRMEHERDLEELRSEMFAQIEAIKGTKNQSWIDKIMSPVIGALSKPEITNKILGKIAGVSLGDGDDGGDDDDDDGENDGDGEEEMTQEEQERLKKQLHVSLNRLEKVFPDTGDFMVKFSAWVKKNPDQAKAYFQMMTGNESESM